jgi:subtilisin family serine protease
MSTIFSNSGDNGLAGATDICTTALNNTCEQDFGGTSAVAPFGAGVIALGLQANPSLSWRDVQHIVVRSSKKAIESSGHNFRLDERSKYFFLVKTIKLTKIQSTINFIVTLSMS